jgi:ectoine hydroxylase-related dioxygenase (phytanoyl-CoA dioxygenase family)
MMTNDDFLRLIQMRGWVLFPGVVDEALLPALREDLQRACQRCRVHQVENGLADDTGGTAHHILGQGDSLDAFFARGDLLPYIQAFLGGPCILNSYGGFANAPNTQAYVTRVHRDVRTYTPGFPLMLNMLVMLDDFTAENGATHLLTGSHHLPEKPDDPFFFAHSDRLLGHAGDIALFDSRLWHSAGHNSSRQSRRALTLTFTRPFVKPQVDYPRFVSAEYAERLGPELRQLLGFKARVPASLDEWYQPVQSRFYQPDQG